MLHYATSSNSDTIFNYISLFLNRYGMVVNTLNNSGYTTIFYAARNGHIKMIRFLVESNNADISD